MNITVIIENLNKNNMLGTRERLILTRIQKIEVIDDGWIEFTSTNGFSFLTNEKGNIIA